MSRKNYALFGLLLCLSTAFTFKQEGEDFIEKIIAKLEKYRQFRPQEKVYLHFDKPYYMAGETMWFKGYLFDGITHQIDSISRVLYVDLIDAKQGKIIVSRTLKCDGSTHGDFALPDTLAEGIYQIRAYTNFMKNYSDEFFFHQDFKIWQGSVKNRLSDANAQKMTEAADVQFFPEGGNAVVGMESRIGFKALNLAGKGVDIQGFVLDNAQDTVVAFQSEHLGMGVFNYTPEVQKTYTAFVRQNYGKYRSFALPKPQEEGFTMTTDNLTNKEKIKILIFNSSPKPLDKASEIIVVAHQRGQLCFIAKGTDSKKMFGLSIPKSEIPSDGIVQITLMNIKGEPLCERLIFNNQNRQINLKITPNKMEYKIREKISLDLEATDAEGKPVEGNFSLAVTDANQVLAEPYQENLLTYLLLSSDVSSLSNTDYYAALRGNVEQPAYYFNKENLEANRHLDVLMMTQGWRRFNWHDLMTDKESQITNFYETGLEVTGAILKPNGKVAKTVTVNLMLKKDKQIPQSRIGETDSLGKFGFYGLDFNDTIKVFVQGMKESGGRNLEVTIDPLKTSPKVKVVKIPFSPIEFNAKDLDDFLKKANEAIELERKMKLNKNQLLEEVVVRGKKNEEPDPRTFYGTASNSLKVDNQLCGGATNVLQMIQGRVPGVQVFPNGQGNYRVSIRGGSLFSDPGASSVYFLLDGMPIDSNFLSTISPCDVEQIDVLTGASASILGPKAAGGAISILTKRGNRNYDYSKDVVSGVKIQRRTGYNVAREFYAPKYEVNIPYDVRPDYRSTLHWQPNVKTDAMGKATITYWNSDAKTNISVIAEGVSTHGLVGVAKVSYVVK